MIYLIIIVVLFLVLWGRRDAGTTEGTQMTAFGWVGLRLRVILFSYLLSFLSFPLNAEQGSIYKFHIKRI